MSGTCAEGTVGGGTTMVAGPSVVGGVGVLTGGDGVVGRVASRGTEGIVGVNWTEGGCCAVAAEAAARLVKQATRVTRRRDASDAPFPRVTTEIIRQNRRCGTMMMSLGSSGTSAAESRSIASTLTLKVSFFGPSPRTMFTRLGAANGVKPPACVMALTTVRSFVNFTAPGALTSPSTNTVAAVW